MTLRDEAMLMLDKRGAVLDTARRISNLLRENNIRGAVIGGVAVVLHGHLRTTRDVDVFVAGSLAPFKSILESAGALFDAAKKEFVLDAVPIHLIDEKLAQPTPKHFAVIEDIATIELADLINLKLRSGTKNITRAQDIADVIGLIRCQKLTSAFASKLDKPLRAEFRKLVAAVKREG